jgi:hypothetical protein
MEHRENKYKQMRKTIGKMLFELDDETNRIMVYEEGEGVEPVAFINVDASITEKEFECEIMWWVSQSK